MGDEPGRSYRVRFEAMGLRWRLVGVAALAMIIVPGSCSDGDDLPAAQQSPALSSSPTATATAGSDRETPSPVPTDEVQPPADVRSDGGSRAATALRASATCDRAAGRPVVDLAWRPAGVRGDEQQVHVTKFARGFETGDYEALGPLPPDADALRWDGVEPGVHYRWRVATRHTDAWTASAVETFDGIGCLSDSPS